MSLKFCFHVLEFCFYRISLGLLQREVMETFAHSFPLNSTISMPGTPWVSNSSYWISWLGLGPCRSTCQRRCNTPRIYFQTGHQTDGHSTQMSRHTSVSVLRISHARKDWVVGRRRLTTTEFAQSCSLYFMLHLQHQAIHFDSLVINLNQFIYLIIIILLLDFLINCNTCLCEGETN